MRALIIAAPRSGSGKTVVTIGIMAALAKRGAKIAPFKVGPDFIDPGYHCLVTGRPSINLDDWMCGDDRVREIFAAHCAAGDLAVIEGVMGLFDGSGSTNAGSTAQIAALLGAPVLLVIDAKGQAGSVAALVQGFARFDPNVHVAGVIFNNVASDNHARILTDAIMTHCPGVAVLGALRRDERLHIPSRHLGLVTADENPLPQGFIDHLVSVIERDLDVTEILETGTSLHSQALSLRERVAEGRVRESVPIAVARDAAFCFVYEDNLRLLREAGAAIIEFSPLRDKRLPDSIAGIYLPGGYPELFAPELAANETMKASVRNAVEAGMPVYGECGGFIYLSRGMTVPLEPPRPASGHPLPEEEGLVGVRELEFVGIFPVTARMLPKRKALGYREVEFTADTILGPAGTVARGHEYHYSEMGEIPPSVEWRYRVGKEGIDFGREGYGYKNCLASYVHLHFGSNPELAENFVASCRHYQLLQG